VIRDWDRVSGKFLSNLFQPLQQGKFRPAPRLGRRLGRPAPARASIKQTLAGFPIRSMGRLSLSVDTEFWANSDLG